MTYYVVCPDIDLLTTAAVDFFSNLALVHPEGKYVVDIDKSIDITKRTPSTRVALRNDSYVLHLGHFLFCLPVILFKFLPVLVHLGAITVHESRIIFDYVWECGLATQIHYTRCYLNS
ncbi:hypothetical protein ACSBR1_023798 [Camellia fascicularis]